MVNFVEEDLLHYDEETLFKVRKSIKDIGLTEEDATTLINNFFNAGILFRERIPEMSVVKDG